MRRGSALLMSVRDVSVLKPEPPALAVRSQIVDDEWERRRRLDGGAGTDCI
jgi:hypothetical protein